MLSLDEKLAVAELLADYYPGPDGTPPDSIPVNHALPVKHFRFTYTRKNWNSPLRVKVEEYDPATCGST